MRFLHESFERNSLLTNLLRNDAGATAIESDRRADRGGRDRRIPVGRHQPDERVQHGRVGSLGDRTRRRGKAQCG